MLTTVRKSGGESAEAELRALLVSVLGIAPERVKAFNSDTALFGSLPEFDSLAVANFLTGFEERFGALIEDHDVEAEDFATFGSLLVWAERLVTPK
jgi:acyl carrier protein